MVGASPLKIIHCFRSPVGGIFRHVRDLVSAQAAAGHSVGILCDSSTGGVLEEAHFQAILPSLKLGLVRIPMRRAITPGDVKTLLGVYRHLQALKPDVVHAHGAKGGAYGRVIATFIRLSGKEIVRIYSPHGGSIHFDAGSIKGWFFFALERFLRMMTDRLIFVSRFEADGFANKIGVGSCPTAIVYNGLSESEFVPVPARAGAHDFGYVGEMRDLKGPDLFLQSISDIRRATGRNITAIFVGNGPDKKRYLDQITELGIVDAIEVRDPTPIRDVLRETKVLVVPSRAESLPYIVLEAIAAQKPLVATSVGGIPEIFEGSSHRLVAPGNAADLGNTMLATLDDPQRQQKAAAEAERIRGRFSVVTMSSAIEEAYRMAL
jgi:glycosyltransferase involved in cell wall biosynthesis